MKCLRFALSGMVLLLCLLGSCSFGEKALEEVVLAEEALTEEEKAELAKKEAEEDPEDGEDEELPGEISPAAAFLGWKAVSENEVVFEFSLPVTVVELNFSHGSNFQLLEEDHMVTVVFEEALKSGQWFDAALLVEDQYENSIDVQVPFRFRHSQIPEMLITEVCTETGNKKVEFIEFKMLSYGNLGELRVFVERNQGNTGSNSKNPVVYEFDPVEVKSGEYVVLHLRTLEGVGCKDEYGEDLNESGGKDASPTARDFWVPGNTKRLRKTDIIYVLDQDDLVLDAVMISEKPDSQWGNDYFTRAAEFLFDQDAWRSADGSIPVPADAVNSTGTTNTRTICRDETVGNTRSKSDWYITDTSGATPGKPNNTNRYTK